MNMYKSKIFRIQFFLEIDKKIEIYKNYVLYFSQIIEVTNYY